MKRVSVILIFLLAVQSAFCISPEDASKLGRPTVAVVLSGGDTRSFGHVELLETLETLGIPIDAVYGSSSGSLIAGLYCAGYSPREIREICEGTSILSQVFDLNQTPYKIPKKPIESPSFNFFSVDITDDGVFNISGLFGSSKIISVLNDLLSGIPFDTNFDNLPTRFVATTVDALTTDLVVFRNGSLAKAVASSMAMPIFFSPIYDEGYLIEDGGFTNNLPVDLARNDGYDIVITEDLNFGLNPSNDDYRSLTGVINSILRLVVDRELKGREELSDVYICPDYQDNLPASFTVSDNIFSAVQIGIENKMDELEAIATLFEDGKYVRDPNRVGDYTILYGKNSGKYEYQLKDWTRELEKYSVISIGISGFDSWEMNSKSLFRNPAIRLGFFTTEIGNSRFGLDVSALWNKKFELCVSSPFSLLKNLYLVPELTWDLSEVDAGIELQFSNRETFSFSVGIDSDKLFTACGILTDNIRSKKSRPEKYLVEFTDSIDPVAGEYNLSASGALNLPVTKRTEFLLDVAVKKGNNLNPNSFSFGGKFMPEFDFIETESFLSAGVSTRFIILKSLIDIYAELNLRTNPMAFGALDEKLYCSLSLGVDSPVGDFRIGLAHTHNKELTVFFDFK